MARNDAPYPAGFRFPKAVRFHGLKIDSTTLVVYMDNETQPA
jgi:hypothetical protein